MARAERKKPSDLDPKFRFVRERKMRQSRLLRARDGEVKGDMVTRVPGHVYGVGEVVSCVRTKVKGQRVVHVRYDGEPELFQVKLDEADRLEIYEDRGPKY